MAAPWPGDARQLQNTIARLVVLAEDEGITEAFVRQEAIPGRTCDILPDLRERAGLPLREALHFVEGGLSAAALDSAGGL